MSLTYSYINRDKRQFFACGLHARTGRYSAIGLGPGARALALLISEQGTWYGDRICIIHDACDEFAALQTNGVDIAVDVILMLLKVDGLSWVEDEIDAYFMLLCNFAFHLRDANVTALLDHKFGAGNWQRRYEKHLQGNHPDIWPQRVIAARDRNLRLYGSLGPNTDAAQ